MLIVSNRELEDASVEALVELTHPGAVEEEDLERVLAAPDKHEECAAAGISAEDLAGDAGETVEAPPEIDVLESEEDLDAVRNQAGLRVR